MIQTTIEKTAEIRHELRKRGIGNRQVSVKSRSAMYDTVIEIVIKDLKISRDMVEEIAGKHEHIDRDERTGEYLQGGNTFIHISFDYDILQAAIKDMLPEAQSIYDRRNNPKDWSSFRVYTDNKYEIFYYPDDELITLFRVAEVDELEAAILKIYAVPQLEKIQSCIASNAQEIASAMVYFKNQYINQ